MICYDWGILEKAHKDMFQTKLTYGMICYKSTIFSVIHVSGFQTKLTYGMICYMIINILNKGSA